MVNGTVAFYTHTNRKASMTDKKKPGRPQVLNNAVRVHITIEKEMRDKVKKQGDISTVIRDALDSYFKN